VVETNVHFPSDIGLLWDAMRKAIILTGQWCENRQLSHWRQYCYNLRQLKRLLREVQNRKRCKGAEKPSANYSSALSLY